MAASDATAIPVKNQAYRATFPILDNDGDLVTGAASLDSEVSKDGGTFADCTNEATEIATSSGVYYLDLTATEMNADTVAIIVKTSTSDAKTTVLVLYPEETGDINVDVTAMANDVITAAKIATGAIDADAIADNAIDAGALAADCITAAKIATGAIDADAIADNAIDAGAIATGAITAAKFAAGAIDAAAIAADAISAAKIADGAIDAATFAAGAINAAAIASDAITAAKIADGAIDAGALAADAITAAKIADGAIDAATFAAGAIDAAAIAANAIGASELATDAVTEIVNAILTTQMTEAYSADGAAPTLAQALFLILQRLTEFSISSTTITVKKLDGTTTAYTLTLNDATSPTSSTRAT